MCAFWPIFESAPRAGNHLAASLTTTFTNYDMPPTNAVAWISDTDGDWDNAANWNTGAVPTETDTIIIDRKTANPTVSMTSGAFSVKRLLSSEYMIIANASLTVTDTFTAIVGVDIQSGATLIADGASAYVAITGPTTATGANLSARAGGEIHLPNLTSYDGGPGFVSTRTLEARGAGSLLDLSTVTSFRSHTWTQVIQALDGGRVDLSHVPTISQGTTTVTADGANSVVDLSALTSFDSVMFTATNGDIVIQPGQALLADVIEIGDGQSTGRLTTAILEQSRNTVLSQFVASGLDESRIAMLRNASLQVADLSGRMLGWTLGTNVLIDRDAAGFGWFVDPTPFNDEEFSDHISDLEARASSDSPAAKQMDLLAILSHEFGHPLGFEHDTDPGHLMSETLAPGTRLLPIGTGAEIDDVFSNPDWP